MPELVRTPRSTVKRRPQRASYDRAVVEAVLDAGLVCHVGFAMDGAPFVIPTGYVRVGDRLYLHGSAASRMLRTLAAGAPLCVTVTLVDGLVLARSAFHHSLNYRSVVVLGSAVAVTEETEKVAALRAFVEHVMPGRWAEVRPPSARELAATLVVAVPIVEASAKVRSGPPLDDEEDHRLPVWAGELPLRSHAGPPLADARLAPGLALPPYVQSYRLPRQRVAAP